MKKVLVVSAWAPPMVGGSPIALGKLLRGWPEESYVILTTERREFRRTNGAWLPCTYSFLHEKLADRAGGSHNKTVAAARGRQSGRDGFVRPLAPVLRPLRDIRDICFRVPEIQRQAVRLIAEHRVDVIVAPSDDGTFLLGAYRAARRTGTPLTVLLFDIYAGNNYSLLKRLLARVVEGKILRSAKAVVVTNEKTREHYRALYGVNATVLHHGSQIRENTIPVAPGRRILYSGSIYWAQRDGITNLIAAMSWHPEAHLDLLTDANDEEVRRLGSHTERVHVAYVPAAEVHQRQRQANVLFLPLTFRAKGHEVVKTATPAKLPEYLASGVPILVHAPGDSYIAEDARAEGWGLVVDSPDPSHLAQALATLFSDSSIRERLVVNALRVARQRHDEYRIAQQFVDILS